MALIIEDRVCETSTSTGTGAFTLAGAVTGFKAFSAVCSTSDTCYYLIEAVDTNGVPTGDWETGLGTYSAANTLTRTTVSKSSNANAAVTFAAGTKRVAISSISLELAGITAAEVQAGTAKKIVTADKLLASAAIQTLTDGATIAWDMSLGYNAKVTLGGNRTLAVSNPVEGITYSLGVNQDATGSRTMTWPASFNWGTTGAPTLTTTASKRDRITLICTDAATPKFDAFLSGKGF